MPQGDTGATQARQQIVLHDLSLVTVELFQLSVQCVELRTVADHYCRQISRYVDLVHVMHCRSDHLHELPGDELAARDGGDQVLREVHLTVLKVGKSNHFGRTIIVIVPLVGHDPIVVQNGAEERLRLACLGRSIL